MSASEVVYSFAVPYLDVLEAGRTQTLKMAAFRDGAVVAPTAATFTLYDAGGNKLVDAAAATISGGWASYSLSASVVPTTVIGGGFAEEWLMTMPNESSARSINREAVVSKRALRPVVADFDLLNEYPSLRSDVTGFQTSLQRQLDHAWSVILRKLESDGVLAHRIISAQSVADWHRNLALHFLFKMLYSGQEQSRFRELYELHWTRAEADAGKISFVQDLDGDGLAESEARESRSTVVHVNAAPFMRRRVSRWW